MMNLVAEQDAAYETGVAHGRFLPLQGTLRSQPPNPNRTRLQPSLEITMERRTFLNTALAAAGAALAPRMADAAGKSEWDNVVFTEAAPGHWKGKEKLHVPIVEIKGDTITVTTPHPMSESHFIVSHTVVLQDGHFLNRKTFTWKDAPVSTHTLPPGYKGKVIVTSTCNLHDWWMQEQTV